VRRAWLVGGAAHTALGADLAGAVGRLDRVAAPDRAPLHYGDSVEEVPYRLLADKPLERLEERLYEVLADVVQQALDEAGISASERAGMGLFLGSSSADVSVSEARFRRELAEDDQAIALIASNSIANLALHLRRRFGLGGPDFSFNTACTASANALAAASEMVARGRLDNALVVGVELFNIVTASGFQSLGLLSESGMRPFDEDRNGLVLGEGCSALVVSADRRGAGEWHLRGSATLCDTYSMSTTNPDGSTVAEVIRQAIGRAELAPADIAAVKVHEAGIPFGFATLGAETGKIRENLRRIVAAGLSEDDALAALTTTPAALLGLDRSLGTVEPGKMANLVVTDGPYFDEDSRVRLVFVDGARFEIEEEKDFDPDAEAVVTGTWDYRIVVDADTQTGTMTITDDGGLSGSLVDPGGTTREMEDLTLEGNRLSFRVSETPVGPVEISGLVTGDAYEADITGPVAPPLTLSATRRPE